jgi:hypothetical protein
MPLGLSTLDGHATSPIGKICCICKVKTSSHTDRLASGLHTAIGLKLNDNASERALMAPPFPGPIFTSTSLTDQCANHQGRCGKAQLELRSAYK